MIYENLSFDSRCNSTSNSNDIDEFHEFISFLEKKHKTLLQIIAITLKIVFIVMVILFIVLRSFMIYYYMRDRSARSKY